MSGIFLPVQLPFSLWPLPPPTTPSLKIPPLTRLMTAYPSMPQRRLSSGPVWHLHGGLFLTKWWAEVEQLA